MKTFLFLLASVTVCDDGLWKHVYHKQRLKIINPCASVTGTVVDATHGKSKDGARHEKDGDPHSWLKLDAGQPNITNAGNDATQEGNLVYEIPCMFKVTQPDAIPACKGYTNKIMLPPVGAHVKITGALVEDLEHLPVHREIHPVSSIEVLP